MVFDLQLSEARRPLFYRANNNFYFQEKEGLKVPRTTCTSGWLMKACMPLNKFEEGSASMLSDYFRHHSDKPTVKVAYFGSERNPAEIIYAHEFSQD